MIERVYLDNFRSFVNFEWRPGQLALLLGPNGAGKTALLEALDAVQAFVKGETSVSEAFPASSRTRWETRVGQTIELDVRIRKILYRYRLVVTHDADDDDDVQVASEALQSDDGSIVEFRSGDLTLFRDQKPQAMAGAKPTRSGVGALASRPGDALAQFQDWISTKLWLIRPDPRAMSGRVQRRRGTNAPWLEPDLSNFAAWYVPTLAAKPGSVFKAHAAIAEALPGFVELFEEDAELSARFERDGTTSTYRFDELSDGERALVALYVILHAVAGPNKTIVFDEPDNYLALREIQPWLAELADRTLRADGPQVLLVSHHPDALNFLAVQNGWRVFRDRSGPSRIERFQAAEALDAAETVARGWDEPA